MICTARKDFISLLSKQNIVFRAKSQKQSDISLELWEKQSEIKLNRGYSDKFMVTGTINYD